MLETACGFLFYAFAVGVAILALMTVALPAPFAIMVMGLGIILFKVPEYSQTVSSSQGYRAFVFICRAIALFIIALGGVVLAAHILIALSVFRAA